ncbi:MAG: F0F1 ATP synthase subunit A [Candidatus Omnitrophica bacterium]|nr:F0F1 ATP synthase subunit A [Candidatus Omnitrophota bacterium]
MVETPAAVAANPEFPNIISMLGEHFKGQPLGAFLMSWESTIYCVLVIGLLSAVAYYATRRRALVPGMLQNAAEFYVTGVDDFVCSVLGPRGRKYTPFIGTLFIYILAMNYLGLIPFFKSPTAELSTTVGLSLIVFVYVQYTALKELGVFGYVDHLMGKPRGIMALTIIMPIFMLVLHLVGELIRPLSLSLRLRSNIWGDEMLLALLASKGLAGIPILFMNFVLVVMTSTIQAGIFALLTLIYFALILVHDEEHH